MDNGDHNYELRKQKQHNNKLMSYTSSPSIPCALDISIYTTQNIHEHSQARIISEPNTLAMAASLHSGRKHAQQVKRNHVYPTNNQRWIAQCKSAVQTFIICSTTQETRQNILTENAAVFTCQRWVIATSTTIMKAKRIRKCLPLIIQLTMHFRKTTNNKSKQAKQKKT